MVKKEVGTRQTTEWQGDCDMARQGRCLSGTLKRERTHGRRIAEEKACEFQNREGQRQSPGLAEHVVCVGGMGTEGAAAGVGDNTTRAGKPDGCSLGGIKAPGEGCGWS